MAFGNDQQFEDLMRKTKTQIKQTETMINRVDQREENLDKMRTTLESWKHQNTNSDLNGSASYFNSQPNDLSTYDYPYD